MRQSAAREIEWDVREDILGFLAEPERRSRTCAPCASGAGRRITRASWRSVRRIEAVADARTRLLTIFTPGGLPREALDREAGRLEHVEDASKKPPEGDRLGWTGNRSIICRR